MNKPDTTLIMFTPLPPLRNGIADYSFEVLNGLKQHFRCIAVCENGRPAEPPQGVDVIGLAGYLRREAEFRDAPHVYQIGNNPDHAFCLPMIARTPGLVVLHDPSLHHLADYVTVMQDDLERYCAAMEAEHGLAGRTLADQFRKHRLRETRMYFDMPMTGSIIRASKGMLVHSLFAAGKVLGQMPQAEVTVVPHQYSPPALGQFEDREDIRHGVGVGPDEVMLVSLGFVTRSKQIDATLRALASIRHQMPPFRYVIAGETSPNELDVEALAAGLGLSDVVQLLGYVEESEFFSLARAADMVVNLRYPIAGETSGSMIRSLGAGSCVLLVDRGPFSEVPDDCAVKIPWGTDFTDRLATQILDLAKDPVRRRGIGARAAAHVAHANSLERTVEGYRTAIARAMVGGPPGAAGTARWGALPPHMARRANAAAHARVGDRAPLWFRSGLLPLPMGDTPRCLGVGLLSEDRVLLGELGFRLEDWRIVKAGKLPASGGPYDLILVHEESLARSMGASLDRLGALLSFDGVLVWNAEKPQSPETEDRVFWTRDEGTRLLDARGFTAIEMAKGYFPDLADVTAEARVRPEERVWRAVKARQPAGLAAPGRVPA